MGSPNWPDTPTGTVLSQVKNERRRQREKWGEQRHPSAVWLAILAEEVGEAAQALLKARTGAPDACGRRGLLADLRKELIQVAAVTVAWIEALDDGRAEVGFYQPNAFGTEARP